MVVTASPLGAGETEMTQPATVLSDEDLRRRQAASIGDTVGRELGVQSSSFGPAAGRPIIRGLDGARVRVLQGGVDSMDVSSLSPDHMVATDSLNARQIEILRGPASLLYGSGAIGGVVNVVNGLIPSEVPPSPMGSFDLRGTDANDARTAGFDATLGSGAFAMNANGFSRRARDYDTPVGRVANSDLDSRGGGVGASWISGASYAGLGISSLKNDYGIPSPDAPRVLLEQTRWDAAAEIANPFAGITRLKFRAGHNDYEHREIESTGEVATTFTNKAWDSRLELAHVPWTDGKGALGFQVQDRDFAALGEEAIVPPTKARAYALFLVEQKQWTEWTLDGGLRLERETRKPDAELPSRSFSLATFSGGAIWKFSPGLELALNVTSAQRAPSIEELYSNGPHHATESFEIGNPNLVKERSAAIDLTLRGRQGQARWKVSAFASRVRDHVHALSVDTNSDGIADRVDEDGTFNPDGEFLVQSTTQAEARFHGLEAEWRYRPEGDGLGYRIFGDYVHGKLASGDNLPRMSPARAGVEVDARFGAWSGYVSLMRVASQSHTAPLETPTPGSTRVDAEVSYAIEKTPIGSLTLFLQGANLLDEEIRVHTSYLKDFAPLMGRSFTLGLRGEF
ncbi:TonB-dependent receptor [Usitatibacter palustris]|uniref:TonB-dependent receptor n=1 Tax=Usitatibacter palustris TaxID=2732487 RepID=UPI0014894019|nr:TonB-dependent receptor [Usitatibacter palustris]